MNFEVKCGRFKFIKKNTANFKTIPVGKMLILFCGNSFFTKFFEVLFIMSRIGLHINELILDEQKER